MVFVTITLTLYCDASVLFCSVISSRVILWPSLGMRRLNKVSVEDNSLTLNTFNVDRGSYAMEFQNDSAQNAWERHVTVSLKSTDQQRQQMKYCITSLVADASDKSKTPKTTKAGKHTLIILTLDQFKRTRGISARTPGTYLTVNRLQTLMPFIYDRVISWRRRDMRE